MRTVGIQRFGGSTVLEVVELARSPFDPDIAYRFVLAVPSGVLPALGRGQNLVSETLQAFIELRSHGNAGGKAVNDHGEWELLTCCVEFVQDRLRSADQLAGSIRICGSVGA
jgi:hypothetical protein